MEARTALLEVAGRTVEVPIGRPLHLALLRAGIMIETPCGSRGKCRKCRVRAGGDWPPTDAERDQLSAEELAAGFRLSCQQIVRGSGTVAVVAEPLVGTAKTGISRLEAHRAAAVAADPWYDPSLVPSGGRPLGLAVDIGTTTCVAALLDLRTGEELGGASVPNPQGAFGADLMSRLSYALSGDEAREELRAGVTGAVNDLVARLCRRARCDSAEIVAATVVGNTAMHHLFFGLPVEDLALAPYVPAVTDALECTAVEARLALHPRATVVALPNVAGFVGADAVAVMLACGLDDPGPEVRMAADIGTNGEIAIAGPSPRAGGRHRIVCCSAPAGPAFEGGEISQGMRAGPGAVEGVHVRTGPGGAPADLEVDVIGGVPARGICGSGLLDAVAASVRAGLLDPGGRLADGAALPPALADRIAAGPDGRGIRLAEGVVLTQKDVRALQLAKGAIRSGMEVAMREFGVEAGGIDRLWLAGAFGNYLHPEAALACGLVPAVAPDRLQPVGNAAAQGGRLALLSRGARDRAEALGRAAEHVELATHPDFEPIFFEALGFPAP